MLHADKKVTLYEFEKIAEWQRNGERRFARIEFGSSASNYDSVFVYDYDLLEGAVINDILELETLDLKQKKIDNLKKQMEALNG